MTEDMVGNCQVCQKPIPRNSMTYVNGKIFHPDCYKKVENSMTSIGQDTIANQKLKDELQRELQVLKVQLAQLKNLEVRKTTKKTTKLTGKKKVTRKTTIQKDKKTAKKKQSAQSSRKTTQKNLKNKKRN